jgi:hypothetical protein
VHEDDSLITISIGGNNVGFAAVLKYCLKHKFCEPHGYATVERDLAAVKPAISGVLGLLRDKASDARIVVVGYPNFLPASGGCTPAAGILSWFVHLSAANVKFIHQGIGKLDGAIAQAVRDRSNMVFVRPDVAVWKKHTICSSSPWFVRVDLTHALAHSAGSSIRPPRVSASWKGRCGRRSDSPRAARPLSASSGAISVGFHDRPPAAVRERRRGRLLCGPRPR